MKTRRYGLVALACLFLVHGEAAAQSSTDSKVQKLEETVRNLELRVAALEAQLRERNASASVPAGKGSWRKLKNGMSESDVEKLLGSPTKVEANAVFFTWRYGNVTARVQFDTESRKVTGWTEP